MYFGSVKFFRHLILSILALMIIVPLVAAIIATIGNASLRRNVEELKARVSIYEEFKNDGGKFSAADFYTLTERLGVKKEDILLFLSEKYPDILNSPDNYTGKQASGAVPENNAADPNPEDDPSAGASDGSSSVPNYPPGRHTSLYTDLYVEKHADEAGLRYKDDSGHIYLTFDDGPSSHTTSILNYLKKHGVTATFFVIPGKNSSRLLNMIHENGHTIGIHSASHDYKDIYSSVEAFLADFKKSYDLIYKQTGIKPEIFRFPGGSNNSFNDKVRNGIIAEMTRRGFIYFDWNVDSLDCADANWTQMYNTVLSEVADNNARGQRSVILMHDRSGGMNTVLVLEDILIALLKDPKGYKFGKLDRYVRPIQFSQSVKGTGYGNKGKLNTGV